MSYLHSTMYLLKRDGDYSGFTTLNVFTFHYVSIKTNSSDRKATTIITIYIPLCIY